MRYPVSEALDKYSILWLKDFFGCDVAKELGQFENYLRDQLGPDWKQMEAAVRLGLCNGLQWMLEERINPFGEDADVLEATFRIRRSNVQRSAAKNVLAGIYGGFVDQRVRYPGGEILTREDHEFRRRAGPREKLVTGFDPGFSISDEQIPGMVVGLDESERDSYESHIVYDEKGRSIGVRGAMGHPDPVGFSALDEFELRTSRLKGEFDGDS